MYLYASAERLWDDRAVVIVSLPSPASAIATIIAEGRPCSSQGQRCRVSVGDSYAPDMSAYPCLKNLFLTINPVIKLIFKT